MKQQVRATIPAKGAGHGRAWNGFLNRVPQVRILPGALRDHLISLLRTAGSEHDVSGRSPSRHTVMPMCEWSPARSVRATTGAHSRRMRRGQRHSAFRVEGLPRPRGEAKRLSPVVYEDARLTGARPQGARRRDTGTASAWAPVGDVEVHDAHPRAVLRKPGCLCGEFRLD